MARKMKDSGIEWIGEIPEGWETCLYKYCCSVQPGYPFDSAKFSNSSTDGFPLIRIRDITSGEIQTYYTGEYPPNYIVTAGDLLVGMDGDFNVRWWNNDAALLNQRCCRVTEKNSVLRRFLYYVLPFTLQHINTLTYATTVKHLANGDILNSFIAFPSLPAQQNIVHYLDTVCSEIDAILSKTRSSIEEYKKLKQAVITQAVTKGVRGEREMKDSGNPWFGQIPTDWKLSRVGLHFSIILGKMLCNAPLNDTYTLEPYYCAADVHFDGVTDGERKKMWFSPIEKDLYRVSVGDLLVVEGGAGAGGSAIVEKQDSDTYVQNSIMIVRSKGNADNRYLRYLLEFLVKQGYIDVVCNKATIPHFTKDKLSCVPFCLCGEQEEIADYLDAKCAEIDKLIAKKEQLVKELESYKKSLIYEVVTGKREV